MISLTEPRPLSAAIAALDSRTPIATALRSAEIAAQLDGFIRRSAFFSARVTSGTYLAALQEAVRAMLAFEEFGGVALDRPRIIAALGTLADDLGLRPDRDDEERGGLTDVGSPTRIDLIVRTNLDMARGHAAYLTAHSDRARRLFPAQELVRLGFRDNPRDWRTRWNKAIETLGDTTRAARSGKMIAPKGDRIWLALSRFDNPFPPFDFNSGMGLRPVSRAAALRLGIIDRDTVIPPAPEEFSPPSAASSPMGERIKQEVIDSFGGEAVEEDGRIVWEGLEDRF